jgi:acetyl-CoA synthetase (ADP-forming)
MLRHYVEQGRLSAADPSAAPSRPAGLPPPTQAHERVATSALREHEVKAMLRDYGIPVVRERFCPDPDAAIAAAGEIGYPVVLKAVSPDLIHKSDIGGVRLGLTDAASIRSAWEGIAVALAQSMPNARLDGCLLAEMVQADAELIVGLKNDAQFGQMLLVGFGGTGVELDPDTAIATTPVGPVQAERLLRRLRHWPLLDGYRGRRRADVRAVADVIARLSWLGVDAGPALAELDINPLLIASADGRPVAVDARAMLESDGANR